MTLTQLNKNVNIERSGKRTEDEQRSHLSSPEEQQHRLREGLEIVVPVDLRVVPQRYPTKHLHGRRRWGRGGVVTAHRI